MSPQTVADTLGRRGKGACTMGNDSEVKRIAHSPRESARRIGIGHDKLYREIRAGRIKVKKCGRRSLVTVAEEERYIASLPDLELGGAE